MGTTDEKARLKVARLLLLRIHKDPVLSLKYLKCGQHLKPEDYYQELAPHDNNFRDQRIDYFLPQFNQLFKNFDQYYN